MLTAIQLIQEFADKLGLPRPSALVGATDKSSRQYQSLLKGTVRDLNKYRWQQQRVRTTFPSVATLLQGTLTGLFGAGYNGLIKDTMWNDTRHMQIFGPATDQIWQALQTLPNAGPEFQYYISRDSLYISPVTVAAETISVTMVTKFNVVNGSTYKELVDDDTDTFLFPDDVMLKSFEWRWRKQKGESGWEDDYNEAIGEIARHLVKDSAPALSLGGPGPNIGARPGIIIPPGSWNV